MPGPEEVDQLGVAQGRGLVGGAGVWIEHDDRPHIVGHRVPDAADQPAVDRQADSRRQEAFRDAERHVDALRLAPFSDDVAVADDQAGRLAPFPERPDAVAEGLAAEGLVVGQLQVARLAVLARAGYLHGDGHGIGVQPHLLRRAVLPLPAGRHVGAGSLGICNQCLQQEKRQQQQTRKNHKPL